MPLIDRTAGDWADFLHTISAVHLLSIARNYIWLAEFGPEGGRDTFSMKRDGIVAELRARGMEEQLEAIRRELGEESAG